MFRFAYRTVLTILFLVTLPGWQKPIWAVDGSPNGLLLMTTVVPTVGTTKATNSSTASTENTFGSITGPFATNEGYSPLHNAVRKGERFLVSGLVSKGANIDQQTSSGKTALHLAVHADDVQMVRTLLSLGASPLIKDNAGKMPIEYWESGNDVSILKILQTCEDNALSTKCTQNIR